MRFSASAIRPASPPRRHGTSSARTPAATNATARTAAPAMRPPAILEEPAPGLAGSGETNGQARSDGTRVNPAATLAARRQVAFARARVLLLASRGGHGDANRGDHEARGDHRARR